MILYHVGLSRNVNSVNALGVNPAFSIGKRRATYWVKQDLVLWAIEHTKERHKVSEKDLVIYVASFHHKQVRKTCIEGVYFCNFVVRPYAELDMSFLMLPTAPKVEARQ